MDGDARNLLNDFVCWVGLLTEYRASHILREENSPANFVATESSNGIVVEYVIGDLFLKMYYLIRMDSRRLRC